MNGQNESLSYRAFFEHEMSRMIFEGALLVDMTQALNTAGDESDWRATWIKCGEDDVILAEESQRKGKNKTAFECYLRAANSFRLAQYHLLEDIPLKVDLCQRSVTTYRKAITLISQYNVLPLQIPVNGNKINCYLHYPLDAKSIGTIIAIPGLGHSKESLHHWCRYGVERGLAVLVGDGPGYGETRIVQNMRFSYQEFDRYIDGAIDALRAKSVIDGRRIGILGDCYGGYLAYQAAGRENRIHACAIVEGILTYGQEQIKNHPLPPLITYHLDQSAMNQVEHTEDALINANSNFALYLLHAKTDKLIPFSVAERLYKRHKGDKVLRCVEGERCYNNYFNNHYNTVLDHLERYIPFVWDWMAEIL